MYEISQDWVSVFLWFHLIMVGILIVYWLTRLSPDLRPEEDAIKPSEKDEAWPPWH